MGSCVYYIQKKYPTLICHWGMIPFVYLAFFVLLTVTRFNIYHTSYTNIPVGVFSAFTVWHFLRIKLPKYLIGLATFLSNISYTLYTVHFPFLAFFTSAFFVQNLIFNNYNLMIYLIVFCISIAFAYFIWYLFERNTGNVRNWLLKKL